MAYPSFGPVTIGSNNTDRGLTWYVIEVDNVDQVDLRRYTVLATGGFTRVSPLRDVWQPHLQVGRVMIGEEQLRNFIKLASDGYDRDSSVRFQYVLKDPCC